MTVGYQESVECCNRSGNQRVLLRGTVQAILSDCRAWVRSSSCRAEEPRVCGNSVGDPAFNIRLTILIQALDNVQQMVGDDHQSMTFFNYLFNRNTEWDE